MTMGVFELVCGACKGTGEIPDKTNFDRITASPEALAEFISELAWACNQNCEACPCTTCVSDIDSLNTLAWLKQESDTE